MKQRLSHYNNRIIIDKHSVIYNSLTGDSVFIKNRQLGSLDELEKLCQIDQSLEKNLINAGILVDTDYDEIKELEKRIMEGINGNEEYTLHINPTLDCNFRCWYCYEEHLMGSNMKDEVLSNTLDFISKIVEREDIKCLDLGFFGGEPLLYFEKAAKKIIQFAYDVCRKFGKSLNISFTSNGYALTDEIIEFLSQYSCGFQITLDGGREDHNLTRFAKNGSGSYDKIVSNIHKLVKSGIRAIVRINFTSKNVDSVGGIYNSFSEIENEYRKYISFDFQRVWQDRESGQDEAERKISNIREYFRENGFAVHTNYIPKDVRIPCYADKENYILINYNGDIFGCTARDFKTENRIGVLKESGKILYEDSFEERRKYKFSKALCRTCRIAPICGGGCIQRSYESRDTDKCTLGYSEEDKDNAVINILDWVISNESNLTN